MSVAGAAANRARTFWPEEEDTWGGRCVCVGGGIPLLARKAKFSQTRSLLDHDPAHVL